MKRIGAVLLLLALLPATAEARRNKVQHRNVVDAPEARPAVQLADRIGAITSMAEVDGTLYLGAQRGLARVGSDGTVHWAVALPAATLRQVQADERHVAYTAYSLAGVDRAEGLVRFLTGNLGDVPEWEEVTVALLTHEGEEVWTVPGAQTTALSPPALAPDSVGVMYGRNFVAYDRATGDERGRTVTSGFGDQARLTEGFYAQSPRLVPVVHEGHFYTGFMNVLLKTDADGRQVDEARGRFPHAFTHITCGPVVWNDQIVIGNAQYMADKKHQVFGVEPARMRNHWRSWLQDTNAGCGALVPDGDRLYVVTNFQVMAINDRGRMQWLSMNRRGGLFPSANRGLRYSRGSFATVKSLGTFVLSDGHHVYVSADNGGDVITVLERGRGRYVHTLTIGEPILDMALLDGAIAVATQEGVRFIATTAATSR